MFIFIPSADNTAENRSALAAAFVDGGSRESVVDERKLLDRSVPRRLLGEEGAALAINAPVTKEIRDGLVAILRPLIRARYVIVANTALPGYRDGELVSTDIAGLVARGQVLDWAAVLQHFDNELGPGVVYVDGTLETDITDGTYSVDNRSGRGSDGDAYTTVNAAIAAAGLRDTVAVRAGTYREVVPDSNGTRFCFIVNKTIRLEAYDGEPVTLTYDPDDLPLNPPKTDDYNPIIFISADGVIIDGNGGLIIVGTRTLKETRGSDADSNIQLQDDLSNVVIRRIRTRESGHTSIKFNRSLDGIIIEQNIIEDNGTSEFGHGIYISKGTTEGRITIRHNVIYGGNGSGIQLFADPHNIDIYGNVIFDNNNAGLTMDGDNLRTCNNTIYRMVSAPGSLQEYGQGLEVYHPNDPADYVIRNNVILKCEEDIHLDNASGIIGSDIANNLYSYGTTGAAADFDDWWQDGGTDIEVAADYDPGFVAADPQVWTDFRLAAGSPLIDAGGASPFNELLDPTVTDWPTPKTVTGTLPIGAFASE